MNIGSVSTVLLKTQHPINKIEINMNKPIRVGINGFGRIGRMVARQLMSNPDYQLVAVNDVAEDINNLAYLYNYDSTYRQPSVKASVISGNVVAVGDKKLHFYRAYDVLDVPWEKNQVDILIDSSGVKSNMLNARQLVEHGRVHKIIITNSPVDVGIDRYIVLGVNDNTYDPSRDHVISSSICDVNAIAHPLKWVQDYFGIISGFFTTLHPWLSYQNLLDSPVASQSNPGHNWSDFSLGRTSVGTLIPKNTTANPALLPILPEVADKLQAFSYRIPTATVTSADITLRLSRAITTEELKESMKNMCDSSPYLDENHESLVGMDYTKNPNSAVIDFQWLNVQDDMVKIVLWYDNEWGYSARVVDLVGVLGRNRSS